MTKKLSLDDFISRARAKHGDKYDYSLVEYRNNSTKVKIICPEHGVFEQTPAKHMAGKGCRKCFEDKVGKSKALSQEEFIRRANELHKGKFDYSRVRYVNMKTNVIIGCPIHGYFEQTPDSHLRLGGNGCTKCGDVQIGLKRKLTKEEFIQQAKAVHGDKYDYSQVEYVDSRTQVTIICPIHGPFRQTPTVHVYQKHGCEKCSRLASRLTLEEFISRARAKHGDKYDYSLVEYENNSTKVKIICPEHGIFEQTPADHMAGKGCRKCGNIKHIKNIKNRAMSQEEFIRIATEVHNGKYDYSKVRYLNMGTKVIIGCPIHGDFEQVPYSHIRMGCGCEKCGYAQTGLKLKMSQEDFIQRARAVHGDKYDYSKVEYEGTDRKVTIICPEHGPFRQAPSVHINQKCGCYECGRLRTINSQKIGLERFISDSLKSHTEVYDYSKAVYVNSNTEIEIICPEHGSFFQLPVLHRYGARCPKCCGRNRSTEDYVRQAKLVHGDKYDYSKTVYTYSNKKVTIICPIHGEFLQSAGGHLMGAGCPKCAGNLPITEEEFLSRAKAKYGDKFDYSQMEYINYYTPIKIICPEHGEIMMLPIYHLHYATGCVSCSRDRLSERFSMSTDEYLVKAKNVHGDRYDYSLVEYVNSNTKIKIICKKHNYIFEQDPSAHLAGCGCPKCCASRMELRIWKMLELHNIPFEPQKRFDWLKHIKPLSLDFYLPEQNVAIECQGLQHFGIVQKGKRGFPDFEGLKLRDEIKYRLCKEHGIKILYFCNEKSEYLPDSYFDVIYHNQTDLLAAIQAK